jgi:hypothetical protein
VNQNHEVLSARGCLGGVASGALSLAWVRSSAFRRPGFGVRSNQFGFTISLATNIPVVVEAATNLSNPVWLPVRTNTLVGGTSYFSDAAWTNFPQRFYRLTGRVCPHRTACARQHAPAEA